MIIRQVNLIYRLCIVWFAITASWMHGAEYQYGAFCVSIGKNSVVRARIVFAKCASSSTANGMSSLFKLHNRYVVTSRCISMIPRAGKQIIPCHFRHILARVYSYTTG